MEPPLSRHLPSPRQVLELPEDELGLRLLRVLVERPGTHFLNRYNVGLEGTWEELGPDADTLEFRKAIVEAWDWLVVNRLVARVPGDTSEYAFVTRRGERIAEAQNPLALLQAEERLGVQLHPLIERRVRRQFLMGEYELAALAALKFVEIRVRKLAAAGEGDLGVRLMRQAFKAEGGPLADPEQDAGERQATSDLFVGAIGVFKNPSSHREVEFDDPAYASEVVLLADLLLRMLDRIEARLEGRARAGRVRGQRAR